MASKFLSKIHHIPISINGYGDIFVARFHATLGEIPYFYGGGIFERSYMMEFFVAKNTLSVQGGNCLNIAQGMHGHIVAEFTFDSELPAGELILETMIENDRDRILLDVMSDRKTAIWIVTRKTSFKSGEMQLQLVLEDGNEEDVIVWKSSIATITVNSSINSDMQFDDLLPSEFQQWESRMASVYDGTQSALVQMGELADAAADSADAAAAYALQPSQPVEWEEVELMGAAESVPSSKLKIAKVGKLVSINGAIIPHTAGFSILAILPAEYHPYTNVNFVGSGLDFIQGIRVSVGGMLQSIGTIIGEHSGDSPMDINISYLAK